MMRSARSYWTGVNNKLENSTIIHPVIERLLLGEDKADIL